MMKVNKKNILLIMVLLMLFSLPVSAKNYKHFNSDIKKADKVFENLMVLKTKNKIIDQTLKTFSNNEYKILEENQVEMNEAFYSYFSESLNFDNSKITLLFNQTDDQSSATIVRNELTNSLIMVSSNSNGSVVLRINEDSFLIKLVGQDLIMYSENGEEMPISWFTPLEDYGELPRPYNGVINVGEDIFDDKITNDGMISPMYYTGVSGPFYFTWKGFVLLTSILSGVIVIAGLVAAKLNHPVIGEVFGLVAPATAVGVQFYNTDYVKKWIRSAHDCSTFKQEEQEWYELSNYNPVSYMKTIFVYYHTVNPTIPGGACLNY